MRIGQFTDSFPPIINGVSAFVAEHHTELLARGCDAHVFVFGYRSQPDTQPNIWRSPALPAPLTPFRGNVMLNSESRRAARTLDIYHVHEAFGIGNFAVRMARRRCRPLIFTNHTRHDLYVLNYPRVLQPFLRRIVKRQIARMMRISALSTAPSEDTANWLKSLAPDMADRICVVRNGIRLDPFERAADCDDRRRLGIPCESTVFIYIGRLTPEKNLSVFVDAFVQAVQNGADAHWLVIGDGPCRESLQIQATPIDERARFLGAVPRDQVPGYLAQSDVFATTSLSEVNPVSVIEGLAAGKPFLGLKAGWWGEFRAEPRDGASPGLLVNDERELASAIHTLSMNDGLRACMGVEAKRLSHRFDIRDITAQWIEIYRSAIKRNNHA
jgi:glycosyltransferase involved in cell wall biosynthesis